MIRDWTEAEKTEFEGNLTTPIEFIELPAAKPCIIVAFDGWEPITWSRSSSGAFLAMPKSEKSTVQVILSPECRLLEQSDIYLEGKTFPIGKLQ